MAFPLALGPPDRETGNRHRLAVVRQNVARYIATTSSAWRNVFAWDSRLIRGRRELLPTERGRETGCASALIKEKQLGRQHHSS